MVADKKINLEEVFNMKFDILIGNPPYQDPTSPSRKLWIDFVTKSVNLVKINGIIAMVTPNSWVARPDGQKFKKIVKMFSTLQLLYADLHNVNKYFNVGEDIGFWLLSNQKKYKQSIIVANWFGKVQSKNIEMTPQKIIFSLSDKIKIEIINKMQKSSPKRMRFESEISSDRGLDELFSSNILSKTKTQIHCYEFFWTASQIYYTSKDYIKSGFRLVLNRSGYYFKSGMIDKYMPVKKDIGIGIGGYGISFKDEATAINAQEIMSKKIIRFYIESQKTSGFNTALTKLPDINLNRIWTDAELYKHFNLIQEEIDYVEANVK